MALHRLSPIGRLYLVETAYSKGGTYFAESDLLTRGKDQPESDGFNALMQHEDALTVWELNPSEGTMRDVSEDMARKWLAESEAASWDDLPAFITDHLADYEIEEHYRALAAQRRHERELASPEAMGRV